MPAYDVRRSISVDAPEDRVFDAVADFGSWTSWSPWLGIDPRAEVTVSDPPNSVGSLYRWNGELVGEGELEHVHLDRPHRIEDQLRFVKPFRATCDVRFEMVTQGDATLTIWHMEGTLPWFLFWMRSNMETLIGSDYERGLTMLKEYVETGQVLSKLDVIGIEPLAARDVIGVRKSCGFDAIGSATETGFRAAAEAIEAAGIGRDGEMLSVYHAADSNRRRFDFTCGWSARPPARLPEPLSAYRLAGGRALQVRHVGRYEHLANAWNGAYQFARYKKLKLAPKDSIEVYANTRETAAAADLVTDVFLRLK